MPLPNVPDWTDKEKLAGEKEMLGFWVTGHPLDRYADKIAELATHDTSNLEGLGEGHGSGALRRAHRHHAQAQQGRQAVGRHDASKTAPAPWRRWSSPPVTSGWRPQVVEDQAVLVRGLVLPEEGGAPKISVQDIVPLENARVDLPAVISIRVWIGRNGGGQGAGARRAVPQKARAHTSPAAPGSAAGFLGAAGCAGESAA